MQVIQNGKNPFLHKVKKWSMCKTKNKRNNKNYINVSKKKEDLSSEFVLKRCPYPSLN